MDEVRIYSRALTDKEVYNNYTDTEAITTEGLVSWWKFDGNANDYMGLNNGTVVESPQLSYGRNCSVVTGLGYENVSPGAVTML